MKERDEQHHPKTDRHEVRGSGPCGSTRHRAERRRRRSLRSVSEREGIRLPLLHHVDRSARRFDERHLLWRTWLVPGSRTLPEHLHALLTLGQRTLGQQRRVAGEMLMERKASWRLRTYRVVASAIRDQSAAPSVVSSSRTAQMIESTHQETPS